MWGKNDETKNKNKTQISTGMNEKMTPIKNQMKDKLTEHKLKHNKSSLTNIFEGKIETRGKHITSFFYKLWPSNLMNKIAIT